MNEIDMNLVQVAHMGRQTGLKLTRNDEAVELKKWAGDLLTAMRGVAQLLDASHDCNAYEASRTAQYECVLDPGKTTSARMLDEMRKHNEGFFHFARRMSMQHFRYFKSMTLSPERKHLFEKAARDSIAEKQRIEAENSIDFDEFLKRYFAQ